VNRIDGKIAIVTGGTQGLGSAIARLCAQAGAAGIAIVGRDQTKGAAVAQQITTETGVPVLMIAADLAETGEVMGVVAKAEGHFGRIDILVNAAGLTDRGNLLHTTPELFDRFFAVNVRAPFFLMQEAVKAMTRSGGEGSILNIGSTSSRAGQPFLAAYSASKGTMDTVTRNAGFALMRNRVRVNQLDIGWMASDYEKTIQMQESGDPDWQVKAEAGLPFGRLLDPVEVAKAGLWMVSADSGMMTGAVVQFDQSVWGGYDGQAPTPAMPLS